MVDDVKGIRTDMIRAEMVGVGVIGASMAWHLASRGGEVVILMGEAW
jgi:hypothetical protein